MSDLFGGTLPALPSYMVGKVADRNARFGVLKSKPERKGPPVPATVISGGVGPVGPVLFAKFAEPTVFVAPEKAEVRTVAQMERATVQRVDVDGGEYRVFRDGNAPGINDLHRKKGSAIAGPGAPGRAAIEGLGTPNDPNPGYLATQRKWLPKSGLVGDRIEVKRLNVSTVRKPVVEKVYTATVKGQARG
jgi:hypothetical protein